MRIKTFDHRPVQAIIRGSLDRCFDNRSNEYRAAVIMEGLFEAGFEIVPKARPAAAAVNSLETMPVKVVVFEEPDDVSEGPTVAPKDVHTLPSGRRSSVMTLNEKRILQAIAQRSWHMLSSREFDTYKRYLDDWSEGEASGPRSGYHEALALIRGEETSAVAVAAALGGDGRTGEEGDVWALYDARHRTRARYDYKVDPDLQQPVNAAQG
ncbi:hypothetical protein [Methylobacterium sp. Leaf91]|uniref:hypothetical protein n=1 Tax=Methylobacterium sp. Leaf91 TaxID=1736247 RepID=UPI0006F4CEA8|nr:hypothetical protein [Methylobacterium sp. Leaf91]KQO85938.1 hypothetical protein ASF32_09640 [Methylobacterium sp. Leaf91]